jgi:DNA invertase Pin-like site-specific DNA recombinase
MNFVAYIRVSSIEQNEARQREIIYKQPYSIQREFIDKASGRNTDRTQFQQMLQYVRQGDTIVVESYSRISRSTRDLFQLIETLQIKQVNLISIKENLDIRTPHGKMMITIIAALAEFEIDILRERQLEGIALAKLAGKYKGRKPIPRTDHINQFLDRYLLKTSLNKYPIKQLQFDTGLKTNTLAKFLRLRKQELQKIYVSHNHIHYISQEKEQQKEQETNDIKHIHNINNTKN